MSKAFVIKMCYVHNKWHDISCATLYVTAVPAFDTFFTLLKFSDTPNDYYVSN